jgi:xeroderma pigmentosum group C-complementing protein
MAPEGGKGKARDAPTTVPRRSTRSRKNASTADATPDVYGDMVAEAVAAEPVESNDRPLKRRRMSRGPITPAKTVQKKQESSSPNGKATTSTPAGPMSESHESDVPTRSRPQQTVEYSSESEESDLAFEDVDLSQRADPSPPSAPGTDDEGIKDVRATLAPSSASKAVVNRRKPATTVEKAFRLRVHKIHFLTLLGHCMYVNSRCSNSTVQKILRRLVDKRMRSYLNPNFNDSQFQRNRSFIDGLEQAKAAFKAEYKITMSGMSRPRWSMDGGDEGPSSGGDPMDLADFAMAARDLEGSQDTGNQLFCAMLRAVGVEARLVCSLQTLPYANPPAKSSTPLKKKKPTVFAIASDTDPNLSDASASDGSIGSSAVIGKIPSVRRRLGQPSFTASPKVAPPPREKKKEIRTLSYPVYWVEAFNTAHQKWVPADPMVTNTINKANKIEPPASYDLNQMMYVVAFEEDGVVRDVTRRYAKAFNAKTRRQRIENSGEDGAKWLKAALRLFRRRQRLDRDQVEDSELAQKEAREGLPSNVLDFKGHPYYALERHLRRHEVLHPRREAGKVNAGTAARPKMEPVFRRQDVLSCKGADKWYRLGRKVKKGEQPLKIIPARVSRRRDLDDEGDDGERSMTGLYSIHQTHVYVPPAVKNGRITRNAFGNLDVYVPSMVPPGGEHIRHALAQQAARALNIDFADAVVGFKFQGRQGTAIIEGAVVPREYSDAVKAVIDGLEHQALEDASRARSLAALRLWSRFLRGLRIAERVSAYGDGSTAEDIGGKDIEEIDFASGAASTVLEAHDPTMPTAGQYSISELTRASKPARKAKKKGYESDTQYDTNPASSSRPNGHRRGIPVIDDDEDDGYMPNNGDGDNGGGFLPEDAQEVVEPGSGFLHEAYDEEAGGGFVPDELPADESQGGGFLPEDDGDQGGGFVVEGEGTEELGGGFVPENVTDDMDAGGFLAEESVILETNDDPSEDAAMLDLAGDDNNTTPDLPGVLDDQDQKPSPDATLHVPAPHELNTATINNATNAERSLTHNTAAPATQTSTEQLSAIQPGGAPLNDTSMNEDVEGDSDRDSLISHDPEDDDAEPDWLESD